MHAASARSLRGGARDEPTRARRARDPEAQSHTSVADIAVGVVIGRSSEFFDFFVYAIASVLVFPAGHVPLRSDRSTGVLWSFAIFALAFVARPFGTVIFIGDRPALRARRQADRRAVPARLRHGRHRLHARLSAGGRLRDRDPRGDADRPGLALGGTWDGLASLLAMNAPEEQRGWYAMIPQIGAPVGLFVASALFVYLITGLQRERLPRVGLALSVLRRLRDQRRGAVRAAAHRGHAGIRGGSSRPSTCSPPSVRETLAADGTNVLIGAFTPLATFALFHMVTVFPLSWVYLSTGESIAGLPRHRDRNLACSASRRSSPPASLADRFGRRRLLIVCAVGIAPVRAGGAGAARTAARWASSSSW